jgi:ABC-2 type transport system ATP-binding protein
MEPPDVAIRARNLRKQFGETVVLDDFNLTVQRGTVHGLLGPNGAGKTTAVRLLTTLLRIDSGSADVAGFDVASHPDQVRASIGLVGQHAAVDEILTARQNLTMFGKLYHLTPRQASQRADELLAQFDLADTGSKPAGKFSGGMRRRLDLTASLILAPPILFLDEPTTGLDPRGRAQIWEQIRALVRGGTTVLLTTQYLEEADQLADRISLIDSGRIVAEGTPAELKARLGDDRIEAVLADAADLALATRIIAGITGRAPEVDPDTRRLLTPVADRMSALAAVMSEFTDAGIALDDLAIRRPTLDEVFLQLTGKPRESESPTQEAA